MSDGLSQLHPHHHSSSAAATAMTDSSPAVLPILDSSGLQSPSPTNLMIQGRSTSTSFSSSCLAAHLQQVQGVAWTATSNGGTSSVSSSIDRLLYSALATVDSDNFTPDAQLARPADYNGVLSRAGLNRSRMMAGAAANMSSPLSSVDTAGSLRLYSLDSLLKAPSELINQKTSLASTAGKWYHVLMSLADFFVFTDPILLLVAVSFILQATY
jgi:hypothetical protein